MGIYQLKQALTRVHELDKDISLHAWLQRHPMPSLLWQGCVVPVLLTVCTCDVATLLQWPARPLLCFVDLLLQDAGLYRLHGGTQALASALQQDTLLYSHHAVTAVYQQAQQVWLRDASEHSHCFDHVIVATPTQACGFLDNAQYATEKRLMLQLPYSSGDLVSHTDTSAMPQHRRDWSPLHYSMSRDFQNHSFSVWLNPIEASLDNDATPVFQTWNSLTPLQDSAIVQHTRLNRSVCTVDSLRSVQALQDLQAASSNTRRLWLCGSWSCDGLPVLESAVTSTLSVCAHLGANLDLRLGSAQVVTVSP
ncbi:hypothetical protein LVJ82_12820 [Vitreoscilla massiliensis]|uniref:Amine oxidase domain-containing protein n=1 Tax=Vitreoscilla massiliensis TaxID=1689272 RepID=A0ABY4DYG8_9NEIS|nr:hypothetical protein [Vitreoscilla massiliensis]UOO88352.1 hypothetical protein LVJ82_12820 [Vitreoscilla massiliensis]